MYILSLGIQVYQKNFNSFSKFQVPVFFFFIFHKIFAHFRFENFENIILKDT